MVLLQKVQDFTARFAEQRGRKAKEEKSTESA
jgi:hypothetical protein